MNKNSTGSKNTKKIKYKKTEGTNKNSSAVATVGARNGKKDGGCRHNDRKGDDKCSLRVQSPD